MPALSKYYTPILLFLLCVLVLTQSNFAPFANGSSGVDSGVFIYSAKAIMNSKIMYKEVFDHKGPLIYLINILGLVILNGNLIGVWIVELISLFIATIFFYKSSRLFFDETASFFSVVFALNTIMPLLEAGDLTEEYYLCFAAIALFLFLRALKADFVFSFSDVFLISVCAACAMMLRINLVALWVSFTIVAAVFLVYKKRIGSLITYKLWVWIGIAVVVVPFIVYFYMHHALADAWYANWTFNLHYAHTTARASWSGIWDAISSMAPTHVGLVMLAYFIVAVKWAIKEPQNRILHLFSVLAFLLTLIIGCGLTARVQSHYALAVIPAIIVPAAFLLQKMKCLSSRYHALFCLIAVLCISIHAYRLQKIFVRLALQRKTEQLQIINCIKENTSQSDLISVMGNNSLLYYLSGRNSCSRFHYQFPLVKIDSNITKEYYTDIVTNKPRLILCAGDDLSLLPSCFAVLLNKDYTRIRYDGVQSYRIYRHN